MILRKPYAFLIKYFRILHAIILAMLCYVLYNTARISTFLSSVVKDNTSVIGLDLVDKYEPLLLKLFPLLVLGLLIIIIWVFVFKKKDYKEYLIIFIMLFISYIILLISFGTISNLEVTIQEIRTLRLVRDLVLLSCFLYVYPIIITFIRVTGFDIKKFDFDKDLLELDITEKDREEFEVDFNFDTNLFKRKLNRKKRYLKYFYKQYRFFIYLVLVIAIVLVRSIIYNNMYKLNQTIKYTDTFSNNYGNFNVVESYVVNTDYKGNTLDDVYDYVAVKVQAKTNSDKQIKINTAYFELHINNHIFYHNTEYIDALSDLGKVYNNKNLNKEYTEYLLLYKIPKKYNNKSMELRVIKNSSKFLSKDVTNYYIIKLKNIEFLENNPLQKYTLNEELAFNDLMLKDKKLNITGYTINDAFKINYNCIIGDKTIQSVEYVIRRYYGTYEKTIMKLNYSYTDEDMNKLVETNSHIKYIINNKVKIVNNLVVFNPSVKQKGVIYIEIPQEVKDASYISIVYNIRNSSYEYILRGEK